MHRPSITQVTGDIVRILRNECNIAKTKKKPNWDLIITKPIWKCTNQVLPKSQKDIVKMLKDEYNIAETGKQQY